MPTRVEKMSDDQAVEASGEPGLPVEQNGPSTEAPSDPAGGPLDHDGDGRKGGVHAPPEITYLVVLTADPDRGLNHGDVIGVADRDVKALLAGDIARAASDDEVELAQPRVRAWSPTAA